MFRLQRILSLLALVLATTAGQAQTPPDRPASTAEAQRFLLQATFGPAGDDAESLMKLGYGAWIDRQFGLPATSHRLTWEASDAAIRAITPAQGAGQNEVFDSFWKQALTGPDQLRQRLVFALSEIFVISGVDGAVGNEPRAMAAWLDMLGDKGTTTYRQLLESVSLHPMMGRYLSHLRNQKADPVTGRVPDQNYAREVMQLLSIGLVQLNPDGTPVMVNNRTVETYGPDDVAGLAKVFTGWSWDCPAAPNTSCFNNGTSGGVSDPDRQFKPMIPYPQFHSTEAKAFLGVTIPPQTTPDPRESLRVALNTLDAHPNTAPFISKALIQRFTVSNPSPAYVRAVAGVFINNGAGVRGDLKAVVKAILTHPEARTPANANSTGKLRAGAAPVGLPAGLPSHQRHRALAHRQHRQRRQRARPDPPAQPLGVQLLPPRLRGAQHRHRGGRAHRARDAAAQRNQRSRLGELHARQPQQRRRQLQRHRRHHGVQPPRPAAQLGFRTRARRAARIAGALRHAAAAGQPVQRSAEERHRGAGGEHHRADAAARRQQPRRRDRRQAQPHLRGPAADDGHARVPYLEVKRGSPP
jgi:uncharacterized protein (DUF1800 family)